ncbi:MAG: hypothetical protein F6J93_21995 [Oscillatoria sp. SIO1A7]|nr:hypothetical protein [Oscillatoria sp. SIO1A7]
MAINLKKTFKQPKRKKKPDLKKKGGQGGQGGQSQGKGYDQYKKQEEEMLDAIDDKIEAERVKLQIEQTFDRWQYRLVLRQEFGPESGSLYNKSIFLEDFQQGFSRAFYRKRRLTKEERKRLPVVIQLSRLKPRERGARDYQKREDIGQQQEKKKQKKQKK